MSRGYNVYVIRLSEAVLKKKKFRDRNPGYLDGLPCVYVGMTSCTIEERFAQHRSGYKANKYAREFGRFLLPKRCLLGLDRATAEREEVRLAAYLRGQGWAVWQG